MPDLTAADMDAAVRTIAGSARQMGLEVRGRIIMAKLSKRAKAIREKLEIGKLHAAEEAFNLLKDVSTVKFSEAVDVSINWVSTHVNRIRWFVVLLCCPWYW